MLSKLLALMKTKLFIGIASATALVTVSVATVIIVTAPDAYRTLKVFEVDGTSIVQRSNTDINAYVGMNLESGDTVTVAEDSSMRINLDDNKYISLDGGTVLELIATGDSKNSLTTINLRAGTILNEITETLSENSTYTVNTPKATMAVRGTSFVVSVERLEDGTYHTRLSTAHGKVAVQLIDKAGAPKGEEVTVEPDKSVVIVTTPNEETLSDAEIDGNSFFAIYDTETGEITPVSEDDAKTGVVYEEIPEKFLHQFIRTNDDDEIVLDDDVLNKIMDALSGDTDPVPEETTIPEETTLPEDTTLPEETTISEETTILPVETMVIPAETTAPAVTTAPETTTVPETTTTATTTKSSSSGGSGGGGGGGAVEEDQFEFLAFYEGESSAEHHELYVEGDTVTLPSAPTGFDSSAFSFGWINVSSGFMDGTGLADGSADYSTAFSYDSSLVTNVSTILPAGSTVTIGTTHARYVGVTYSTVTYMINDTEYAKCIIIGDTTYSSAMSAVSEPTQEEINNAYNQTNLVFNKWVYTNSSGTEVEFSAFSAQKGSVYGNVTVTADVAVQKYEVLAFYYNDMSTPALHQAITTGQTVTLPGTPTGFIAAKSDFVWVEISDGFTGTGLASGTPDYTNAYTYTTNVTADSTTLATGTTIGVSDSHRRFIGLPRATITYYLNDITPSTYSYYVMGSTTYGTVVNNKDPYDEGSLTLADFANADGYNTGMYNVTFNGWKYYDYNGDEITISEWESDNGTKGHLTAKPTVSYSVKTASTLYIEESINTTPGNFVTLRDVPYNTVYSMSDLKSNWDNSTKAAYYSSWATVTGVASAAGSKDGTYSSDDFSVEEDLYPNTSIYVNFDYTYAVTVKDLSDTTLGTYYMHFSSHSLPTLTATSLSSSLGNGNSYSKIYTDINGTGVSSLTFGEETHYDTVYLGN